MFQRIFLQPFLDFFLDLMELLLVTQGAEKDKVEGYFLKLTLKTTKCYEAKFLIYFSN